SPCAAIADVMAKTRAGTGEPTEFEEFCDRTSEPRAILDLGILNWLMSVMRRSADSIWTSRHFSDVPIAALHISVLAHEVLRSSIASIGVARTSKPKSAWPTIS